MRTAPPLRLLAVAVLGLALRLAAAAPIELSVDATDLDRRVLQVQQRLPVPGPGRQVLRYAFADHPDLAAERRS